MKPFSTGAVTCNMTTGNFRGGGLRCSRRLILERDDEIDSVTHKPLRRSACCVFVGKVAPVEVDILTHFVAKSRQALAQAVERRRDMIEADVRESDPPVLPCLLRLRGFEFTAHPLPLFGGPTRPFTPPQIASSDAEYERHDCGGDGQLHLSASSPGRPQALNVERRAKQAESDHDREPDPPHQHLGGGWLAGV